MNVVEVDDPGWAEVQRGTAPDPYCTAPFQRAQAKVLRQRPVLLDADGPGWRGHYVLVLLPIDGGGYLARTPEHGGPWLELAGAAAEQAARSFRAEVDATLRELGVVSEVALLSPFLPFPTEVDAAWSTTPTKEVCVADLRRLQDRWSALAKGRRSDISSARRAFDLSWDRLDGALAKTFSRHYEPAMERKHAAARWRLDEAYFTALAAEPDLELWVASATAGEDGAMALFLRAERRAAYLYAVRWGASRGAPAAVVWTAQEQLATAGVAELLLGGGVSDAPDDPLLRFKRSLGDATVMQRIAARVFHPAAHDAACAAGVARPLPAGAVRA